MQTAAAFMTFKLKPTTNYCFIFPRFLFWGAVCVCSAASFIMVQRTVLLLTAMVAAASAQFPGVTRCQGEAEWGDAQCAGTNLFGVVVRFLLFLQN